MKVSIECSFNELLLLERALELYGRVGMLQFNYLTLNNGLQKKIYELDIDSLFDEQMTNVKSLFGYTKNSNPGIFNNEFVGDDSRLAIHLQHQLRHERYKYRLRTGEQTENHYTVDEYPADICQIAEMSLPIFEVKILNQ